MSIGRAESTALLARFTKQKAAHYRGKDEAISLLWATDCTKSMSSKDKLSRNDTK
jgi:hypothetical protein